MTAFKRGDVVMCVRGAYGLVAGATYVVSKVDDNYVFVSGLPVSWNADRFVRVSQATPLSAGTAASVRAVAKISSEIDTYLRDRLPEAFEPQPVPWAEIPVGGYFCMAPGQRIFRVICSSSGMRGVIDAQGYGVIRLPVLPVYACATDGTVCL